MYKRIKRWPQSKLSLSRFANERNVRFSAETLSKPSKGRITSESVAKWRVRHPTRPIDSYAIQFHNFWAYILRKAHPLLVGNTFSERLDDMYRDKRDPAVVATENAKRLCLCANFAQLSL